MVEESKREELFEASGIALLGKDGSIKYSKKIKPLKMYADETVEVNWKISFKDVESSVKVGKHE